MVTLLPYVIIQATDGTERRLELSKPCYRFGRSPEPHEQDGSCNDVVLADRQEVISRYHFELQQEAESWIVIDKNSTNGTIVQRGEMYHELRNDKVALHSEDIIHLPGWLITFYEFRSGTKELPQSLLYICSEQTLYKLVGALQIPIDSPSSKADKKSLRPKARLMLHYMAQCNLQEKRAVCCPYEDLIKHLWPDESYNRTNGDVNGLAKEIRNFFNQALKSTTKAFTLLKTVPNQGYILDIDCQP